MFNLGCVQYIILSVNVSSYLIKFLNQSDMHLYARTTFSGLASSKYQWYRTAWDFALCPKIFLTI